MGGGVVNNSVVQVDMWGRDDPWSGATVVEKGELLNRGRAEECGWEN
jgi:hypothetical protein